MMIHTMIHRRDVQASGLFVAFLMSAVYGAVLYLLIYFHDVNRANAMLSAIYQLGILIL